MLILLVTDTGGTTLSKDGCMDSRLPQGERKQCRKGKTIVALKTRAVLVWHYITNYKQWHRG